MFYFITVGCMGRHSTVGKPDVDKPVIFQNFMDDYRPFLVALDFFSLYNNVWDLTYGCHDRSLNRIVGQGFQNHRNRPIFHQFASIWLPVDVQQICYQNTTFVGQYYYSFGLRKPLN